MWVPHYSLDNGFCYHISMCTHVQTYCIKSIKLLTAFCFLNINTDRKLTRAIEANVLQVVFSRYSEQPHHCKTLFYTKENTDPTVVKNEDTKIPFWYVFFLTNVLKRAWSESDCLERMKFFLHPHYL